MGLLEFTLELIEKRQDAMKAVLEMAKTGVSQKDVVLGVEKVLLQYDSLIEIGVTELNQQIDTINKIQSVHGIIKAELR